MSIFTIIVGASLFAAPAWANPSATGPAPTMEQRTEAFADVTAAMESGNQSAAADGLVAIAESEQWSMFHAEAYAAWPCS